MDVIDYETTESPAMYELGYDDAGNVIVGVCSSLYAELQTRLTPDHRQVTRAGSGFATSPFVPPTSHDWGFGSVLLRRLTQDPSWSVLYPKGSHGEFDWVGLANTSATLQAFFNFARFPMVEADATRRLQLMHVTGWLCSREEKGGEISVVITPTMARWLESQSPDFLHGVAKEAMLRAYERMKGVVDTDALGLLKFSRRERGRISLQFGNQTGLDATVSGSVGYEMHPHNMDSPFHSLLFFAGLAALHQAARDDGV